MDANDEVRQRKPKESVLSATSEYWRALEKWSDSVRSLSMGCPMLAPGLPFPLLNTSPPSVPHMGPMFNFLPPPVPPTIFAMANNHGRIPNLFEEHRIPPLWKRFIAELIDFVLLFFMKLFITFVAVDYFEIVDFNKYDLSAFQNEDKIDYDLALEMTSDLVALELIHRVIVCFYEGLFIAQVGEQAGGATPGKLLMGLRVVSCQQILPGPAPDLVLISPAGPMTLRSSLLRALLKNIVLACIFPVCFPLFFNKFNRAGYDWACRSIVIEETHPQFRR